MLMKYSTRRSRKNIDLWTEQAESIRNRGVNIREDTSFVFSGSSRNIECYDCSASSSRITIDQFCHCQRTCYQFIECGNMCLNIETNMFISHRIIPRRTMCVLSSEYIFM
jgi:hypothetical protein